MVPYSVSEGEVNANEVALCRRITRILEVFPDLELMDGEGRVRPVSCHMLARALVRHFPNLRLRDGHYYPNYQHSWLLTPKGNIIDAYPVAGGNGPFLLAADASSPARHLYLESWIGPRFFSQPWFVNGSRKVRRRIGTLIKEGY